MSTRQVRRRKERRGSMKRQSGFNRREFLKGAALGAVGMTPLVSLLGCAPQSTTKAATAAVDEAGGSTALADTRLTLEELNEFRKELVENQVDYTCEDGTVIPAVYVKVRALFDSYSFGIGSELHDRCFDEFIYLFDEDEAQAYLEMPYGVQFSATDFAVKSGRNEEECLALCEDLATRALLNRTRRGGIPYFNHMAMAYGLWEYRVCGDDSIEYAEAHDAVWGEDVPINKMGTESPFYYSIPTSKEVVSDDEIYLYDDYKKIVERHSVFGVAPCQCQKLGMTLGTIIDPTTRLERCIVLGENAEYCIANDFAREITKEEALAILEQCREEGMVFQTTWTKEPEVLCNCHRDICGILGAYRELGDAMSEHNSCVNVSHYNLDHDKDACIKCGLCMEHCPVECITMNDEGYPTRNMACVRCGQCGLVCPQGARTLSLKDLSTVPDLSDSLLDDYNLKAEYRVRTGMLKFG